MQVSSLLEKIHFAYVKFAIVLSKVIGCY